jgi:hypothetical protein
MGPGRLHPATRAGIAAGVLACFLLLACVAAAAVRDFENPASNDPQQQFGVVNPQRSDTPNDPEYDRAEPDDEDGPASVTNLYDERFDLFGFPSALTRLSAVYAEGPNTGQPMVSGFNAAGAWKLERGRPDVTVAVLDTGIKWDREGLRLQVHLNRGELPTPQDGGNPCSYDCNGDGVFNVADYANDPRVSHTAGPHGSPQIDAEDLIATFSDGTDADGNGFVDDIAGWDFFDNDNDPYDASSYFAAANHGSGRAHVVVERGNDGDGALGVCPHCQLMPIRTWDTFVSDGNTFAMGILYATDNGVKVIEGANGSTYHSAFAEAASNYAYEHGVAQTFSGDDLNTGNHNYPANYGHAMLIQGTVPDTVGLGSDAGTQFAEGRAGLCAAFNPPAPPVGCPGTTTPVKTYFRGANTTQFGGKSSISMEGSTGSENTGKSAGAAAIVISAALDHPLGAIELRPDETRAILEQTAERVTTGNTVGTGVPDPAASASAPPEDQWTSHFGWGRLVRAPQWRKLPRHRTRPGALRDRRPAPLEAPVGDRAGAGELEHGARGRLLGPGHRLRRRRPRTGARRARLLQPAARQRGPDPLSRLAQPLPQRVHGPADRHGRGDPDPRHRPPRPHFSRRPEPAPRLPAPHGDRRRGADPLRRHQRRQRAGPDRPHRGRQRSRLRTGRLRAARLARSHHGRAPGRQPWCGARLRRPHRPGHTAA